MQWHAEQDVIQNVCPDTTVSGAEQGKDMGFRWGGVCDCGGVLHNQ